MSIENERKRNRELIDDITREIRRRVCEFNAEGNEYAGIVDTGFFFGPKDGTRVILLTPAQFDELPDGVRLKCGITGEFKTKGEDYIDKDTRGGFMAWGIPEEEFA